MIIYQFTLNNVGGNEMALRGWSKSTESTVLDLPSEDDNKNVCLCDYSVTPCTYYELAFTDIQNPSSEYVNDYRKFILNPLTDSSTFSFTLIEKDGTEHVVYSDTEQIDSLGGVFAQGFNESQPLQVGVCIKWDLVANAYGFGDYTLKTTQTDFGNTITKESHVFRVVPFDAERANGTIKIEVDNLGVTMNGKNWSGLDTFTNMVRVKGRLNLTDPEIEIDSIVNGNREEKTVQTKLTDNYNISIERVPYGIGYSLINEDIVMNWRVTDYNIFNEDLRNKELIVQSSSVEISPDYTRKTYELTAKSNISKLNRKFV